MVEKSSDKFGQVWILTIASILAISSMSLLALVGSLVGIKLAPNVDLATLPIALFVVGTAVGIPPSIFVMKMLGRRKAFVLYSIVGVIASVIMAYALGKSSFVLFCVGIFLLGSPVAAFQQVRFAAMESVSPEKSATALSIVMSGGIVAAFIGPEIGVLGRLFTDVEYQGSIIMMALGFLLSSFILLFYRPESSSLSQSSSEARPLGLILANPACLLAIFSAAIAFVVMTFVMTATPLSMHHHFGHSLDDTKWVIQSHIIAMFLPSIVLPWLIKTLSIRAVMLLGIGCYSITVIFGLLSSTVLSFWVQLVLLGVGWNFLFFAGTHLLPMTHEKGDSFKVQTLNDTLAFGCQSIAALSAGWALSVSSWETIMLFCLLPMALMLGMLLWEKVANRPLAENV